jgi:excisionase family DNA binding protein
VKLVTGAGVPAAEPEVLTLAEAAQLLRVSPSGLRKMIGDGRVPAFRLGTGPRAAIRLSRAALEEAMARNFARSIDPGDADDAERTIDRLLARHR